MEPFLCPEVGSKPNETSEPDSWSSAETNLRGAQVGLPALGWSGAGSAAENVDDGEAAAVNEEVEEERSTSESKGCAKKGARKASGDLNKDDAKQLCATAGGVQAVLFLILTEFLSKQCRSSKLFRIVFQMLLIPFVCSLAPFWSRVKLAAVFAAPPTRLCTQKCC